MTQEPFRPSTAEPTGGGTPLRRFRGTLQACPLRKAEREGKERLVVDFQFQDIEVLESESPYPFPIASISINYINPQESRGDTNWEAFSRTFRKVAAGQDIEVLVGHRQEWAMLPAKLRRPLTDEEGNPVIDGNGRQVWGNLDGIAWQIVSVDGLGSVEQADTDFDSFIVDLADGKTEPAFHEAALTNSKVTARPNIVTAITERKLLAVLIESGRLSRDTEGVLHKQEQAS